MWTEAQQYQPPTQDLAFLFRHFDVAAKTGFDEETAFSLFEEIGRFARNKIAPTSKPADKEGAKYTPAANGHPAYVSLPESYHELYDAFKEMGLSGLKADEEYGGQGLPFVISGAADEMFCTSNMSFAALPGLTSMAAKVIAEHGSEEQKSIFLPKMVAGDWSGTMNLTEPQCGTDLGAVKTKATLQEDGSYAITGNKIFITMGDQDITENTVHLVLARMPDTPEGTKGLSLFAVPKFLPQEQEDGSIISGDRNAVECIGMEEKIGLHSKPTCSMSYNGATGYLIGEPNKGLRQMFTMMNAARLAVGAQGIALAESAYQATKEHAADRSSFGQTIDQYPNVQVKLERLKAFTEGARALSMWTAMAMDLGTRLPDDDPAKSAMMSRASLMTPVMKGFFTDTASDLINESMIVWGGSGYIEDNPIAQITREAPISRIYEGTSDIIALDVLKQLSKGHLVPGFLDEAKAFVKENKDGPQMAPVIEPFAEALNTFESSTMSLLPRAADMQEMMLIARPYMEMFGQISVGLMWAQMAHTAVEQYETANESLRSTLEDKYKTAQFYMKNMLNTDALAKEITLGMDGLRHISLEDVTSTTNEIQPQSS